MATATAFVSAVLPEINAHLEQVTFTSAGRIVTSNGPDAWRTVYYGDFTVSGSGRITGAIERVVKFFDDVKHYSLTGLSADAGFVFTSILDNFNEADAAAHMLRQADVIDGSQESDAIKGFGGNDTINGNGGNEQVYGGFGRDLIFGGVGLDNLTGDAGADTIFGNVGIDVLDGGDGADRLIGGAGNDILGGGAGRDVYVFDLGAGTDDIRGFEDGIDRIEIVDGAEKFSDLTISGNRVQFGNVEIILTLFNMTLLGAEDFIFS